MKYNSYTSKSQVDIRFNNGMEPIPAQPSVVVVLVRRAPRDDSASGSGGGGGGASGSE